MTDQVILGEFGVQWNIGHKNLADEYTKKLTASIIWKYVHGIYTEINPQYSYQERQRQVLCDSVLEVCLMDLSVWPHYRESQLGTPNWGHQTSREYI